MVTGSGSGKSSLVFDTLFAEGQRRYVETFSAYARQFLNRMWFNWSLTLISPDPNFSLENQALEKSGLFGLTFLNPDLHDVGIQNGVQILKAIDQLQRQLLAEREQQSSILGEQILRQHCTSRKL